MTLKTRTTERTFPPAIAVDFDGTLCANRWPEIGSPNHEVIDELKGLRCDGWRVILWTCREGERLNEAVAWCADKGLYFDAVNANLPERMAYFGGDCRKISADEYWDDRAVVVKAEVGNGVSF